MIIAIGGAQDDPDRGARRHLEDLHRLAGQREEEGELVSIADIMNNSISKKKRRKP